MPLLNEFDERVRYPAIARGWNRESKTVCIRRISCGNRISYVSVPDSRILGRKERCPICGGLNPGDITHTRCQ